MKRWRAMGYGVVALWVGIIVLTATSRAAAPDGERPRLFLTPARIKALRELIQVKDSHHALAYATMEDRVDNNRAARGDEGSSYVHSYRAREAALLALLSEDPLEAQQYAKISLAEFNQCTPLTGSGLARGMNSLGMAIAYDFCHDLWGAAERQRACQKLIAALDAWPKFSHANLGDVRGSNWVAVTRGAELVMLLAAGEEKQRAQRYAFLKKELTLHIRNGFGDLGVTQEGIGYTEYPGAFLLPAVFAAASIGDQELLKVAQTRAWWKMVMYSHTFQEHQRKTIMSGVTSGATLDEGWASLLLHLCPKDQLPYFLWWYDRHLGKLSARQPHARFDANRAGTVWALVYYPQEVQAQDPTGVFPAGVADNRGYYFFRNRWRDTGDVQVSLMADAHRHGHAWDQPEQLSINLLAFNTRFFGGPAKNREDKYYSTLLVDGKYNIPEATKLTGEKVAFEADNRGGYVIVGGGELYKGLGVEQAQRHLLVDFALPDGQALLATLDRITSLKQHTYTWQGNLGGPGDDDGIECSSGSEDGRPFFLLQGRAGAVKGWVIHPADAKLTTGDPLRIDTTGANADIWVVMWVGAGKPPLAKITGQGLQTILTVAGKTLSFDATRQRLTCK